MRILLLAVLAFTFAAACQYSPGTTGTPESLNASAAPVDTPNADAPGGDAYYETYIGRYDLNNR